MYKVAGCPLTVSGVSRGHNVGMEGELFATDEYGSLYRKELRHDEPLLIVRVTNATPEADGTFKDYFLRVPPHIETAKEAVAWTFGLTEREYAPEQES